MMDQVRSASAFMIGFGLLLFLGLTPCFGPKANADEFQQQVHVTYKKESGLTSDLVTDIGLLEDVVFVATEASVSCLEQGKWKTIHESSAPVLGLTISNGQLWFAEGDSLSTIVSGNLAKRNAMLPPNLVMQSLIVIDARAFVGADSHRLDVIPLGNHVVPSQGGGFLRNGHVIPIDERNLNRWNQDPWRLDSSDSGQKLADRTAFLLP